VRKSGRRACSTNAWRLVPGVGRQGTLHDISVPALDLASLLASNHVICSSAVVHRSLIAEVEGFPEAARLTALEDYALWLRVACFTEFDYLAVPHVDYRDDPPNSLRADGLDGAQQRTEVFSNFFAWCDRHPGEATRLGRQAGRRWRRREKLQTAAIKVWSYLRRLRRGLAG